MLKKLILMVIFCTISSTCFAAGSTKVAFIDRTTWPVAIVDTKTFNEASEAEILRFVEVIANTPLATKADIISLTKIKKSNDASVQNWLTKTKTILRHNYKNASSSNVLPTWKQLVIAAKSSPWRKYKDWYAASGNFYARYLYEQVRLAALFPRIPSEIATHGQNETTGFSFKDGEFLLTFDDGPSKAYTKSTIAQLNKMDATAFFFILGKKMQKQAPDAGLYANQCLAAHGWEHSPHKKLPYFIDSYKKTANVLANYTDKRIQFRPPYGMRTKEMAEWAQKNDFSILLWNIDSQDWNRKLSAQEVTDRVTTLMLLWRKGIILFHDIHPKAQKALPTLDDLVSNAGFSWIPCSKLQ